MSLPREPRQKMINMMYLVLTALLALNVSAEILNAFKTVNRSLENTNTTVNKSTETIMKSLEDKMSDPTTRSKAEVWLPRAKSVQSYTATVYSYIKGLKDEIIDKAGGDVESRSFKADNLDIATRMMIDKGKGKELLQKLSEYKKNILAINDSIKLEFENTLPINLETPKTQSKSNNTWERAYFHMVPTVAALTILSKFQNDVKTTENRVVQFCHNKVGEVIVRFDTYAAIIGQSSNYVMPGQKININAGVGAFSKAALPQITIGGKVVAIDETGVAKTDFDAGTIGDHTIPVHIEYKDQDGNPKVIDQKIEYTVGQANASIALDKMNVLYIGVANPISVAASGGGDDKITVNISGAGGRLEKTGPGKYNAWVNNQSDDCIITVSVDGKPSGASKFRTRMIPKPIAVVGPYNSGDNVPVNAFRAQAGVGAGVRDFPFELKYSVTRFVLSADNDEGYIDEAVCQGNTFSSAAQGIMNKLKAGRTVTVDEIYATGPDGRSQKLPSLVFYIK
jgi:gliding motility-associated protein GldM